MKYMDFKLEDIFSSEGVALSGNSLWISALDNN